MLLLLLADGFEEIEALGTLDLLRRGGVEVEVLSVTGARRVVGAHGIVVEAEGLFPGGRRPEEVEGVILPGGMGGARALAGSAEVLAWVRALDGAGRLVCAICAAPALVLPGSGVLREGRRVTCYPAPEFVQALGGHYVDAPAVVDGGLITGAGPGAFAAFARAILGVCRGEAVAERVFREALL